MKDFLRPLGPTAVVLALVLVVGGATATIAQNLITGADIKDGSIKAADLDRRRQAAKIADGQVKASIWLPAPSRRRRSPMAR